MSARLKCEGCGGAVEYSAREQAAACLFCGLNALVLSHDDDSAAFAADAIVPMRLSQAQADAAYRSWARASWWRPKALRSLDVSTQPIFLPAWRFVCDLQTHWAGLRRAPTASGKAPQSGRAETRMEHVIPASGGLESAELWGLWPFDSSAAEELSPGSGEGATALGPNPEVPRELPAKSRKRAATEVHGQVQDRHRQTISKSHGLSDCRASSRVTDVSAKTLLLPVYVGVFRFRDLPWRFLVNAQTGEVYGRAPVDRLKVASVVGLSVLLVSTLILVFGR